MFGLRKKEEQSPYQRIINGFKQNIQRSNKEAEEALKASAEKFFTETSARIQQLEDNNQENKTT